jgi:Lrp/AsnC family transcriptional regulator, leucine-responsive regulatory protein
MSRTNAHLLDQIGWNILHELQQNARIPFAELGRRVGLSTPAVAERVHHMVDAQIIRGYRTEVDPMACGYNVLAFVRVNVAGDKLQHFVELAKSRPEVLECHRVTGSDSFILKVAVTDMNHLETALDSLMPYVATTTSMILSSAITWGPVKPREKRTEAPLRRRGNSGQTSKTLNHGVHRGARRTPGT